MLKETNDENNIDNKENSPEIKPKYTDFIKDTEKIEAEIKREEEEKRNRIKKKLKIENIYTTEYNEEDIINNAEKVKKISIAVGAVLSVIVILYLIIAFGYYNNRFLPSTVINEIDCSGKTVNEVNAVMAEKISDYHLTIVHNNITVDEIYGKDINLEYGDMNITLDDICTHQQKTSWLKGLFAKSEPIYTTSGFKYDTAILNQFVDSSLVLGIVPTKTSVNASIQYNGTEFIIKPAVFGDEIDKNAVKGKILLAINSLDSNIDINKDDCFIKPTVTENDDTIIKSCKNANSLIKNTITLTAKDDVFEIPVDIKADWYTVDDNGSLILDTVAFNSYMDKVDASYSANTEVRKFKTMYGDDVKVTGGDFGTALDRVKFKNDMETALFGNKDTEVAASFVSTVKDIGGTYIEVDLSNQAMAYFADGVQKLYSPVITGRNGKDYETPEGVYRLKSKAENMSVQERGESKTVKYWLSIGKNLGICDALWKNVFGSQSYKTDGSDGSVYAIEGTVKELFDLAAEGTPVVLYHHSIVDNFYTEDTYMAELYDLIANKPEIPTYDGEGVTEETTAETEVSEAVSENTDEDSEPETVVEENEAPTESNIPTENEELPTTE